MFLIKKHRGCEINFAELRMQIEVVSKAAKRTLVTEILDLSSLSEVKGP